MREYVFIGLTSAVTGAGIISLLLWAAWRWECRELERAFREISNLS